MARTAKTVTEQSQNEKLLLLEIELATLTCASQALATFVTAKEDRDEVYSRRGRGKHKHRKYIFKGIDREKSNASIDAEVRRERQKEVITYG
jgi:hypothetical protein